MPVEKDCRGPDTVERIVLYGLHDDFADGSGLTQHCIEREDAAGRKNCREAPLDGRAMVLCIDPMLV